MDLESFMNQSTRKMKNLFSWLLPKKKSVIPEIIVDYQKKLDECRQNMYDAEIDLWISQQASILFQQ